MLETRGGGERAAELTGATTSSSSSSPALTSNAPRTMPRQASEESCRQSGMHERRGGGERAAVLTGATTSNSSSSPASSAAEDDEAAEGESIRESPWDILAPGDPALLLGLEVPA